MRKQLGFLFAFFCSFEASVCFAADATGEQGTYIGLFGGFGSASSTSLRQEGGFYLPGPLGSRVNVDANGETDAEHVALGGVQAGYEWRGWNFGQAAWGLKPAVELEGLYIRKHSPVGDMPITPGILGTQYVTVPMTVGALLASAVFTVRTPYSSRILPYLGVGAGVARMSIDDAYSANPSEPGINHFDSNPDASASALAMQFKLGLKGEVAENLRLFVEYRYLSINSTHYTFGETLPPHLPTDPWSLSMGRQTYNLVVTGMQYRF